MNRHGIRNFRRADDGGNIQIALSAFGRADADGFIRETRVQTIAVGFGVDSYRADAKFLAGADDA